MIYFFSRGKSEGFDPNRNRTPIPDACDGGGRVPYNKTPDTRGRAQRKWWPWKDFVEVFPYMEASLGICFTLFAIVGKTSLETRLPQTEWGVLSRVQ